MELPKQYGNVLLVLKHYNNISQNMKNVKILKYKIWDSRNHKAQKDKKAKTQNDEIYQIKPNFIINLDM